MAASAFLVKLADDAPVTKFQGGNAMVVWADDATMAKQVASSWFDGDSTVWTDSTTTATAIVADADSWENFSVNIVVAHPTTYAIVANVTVDGDSTNDTIDEIAAALVTALNATTINGAAYNSTTNVLKVAETTDGIGDHTVTAKVYRKADPAKQAIPTLIGTVTHQGASGDALTIQLATDALNVPKVYAIVKA